MSISCKLTLVLVISAVVTTLIIVPLVLQNRKHKADLETTGLEEFSSSTQYGTTERSTTSVTPSASNGTTSSARTTITTSRNTSQTSVYTSELRRDSPSWCYSGGCTSTLRYYYEAVKIDVSITGSYDIVSSSNIDTFGFIYNQAFDSRFVDLFLIDYDDDSGNNQQFRFTLTLNAGQTYVLVLTTYRSNITGPFTIIATGPGPLSLSKMSNTTSTDWGAPSNFSSAITRSSPRMCLTTDCPTADYFYETLSMRVFRSGFYMIVSSSPIDTYGYIYSNTFNPLNIDENLLRSNEDGYDNLQFLLALNLYPTMNYTVVVRAESRNVVGIFALMVYGPGAVSFG